MLLKSDAEKIQKTNGKCPFVAKKCDGLCNNCGLDIVPENNHRIVPARNWWNQNDYEGAILARQENMDFLGRENRTMNKVPRYMKEYASSIKKSAEKYKKRFNHENDDPWNETIESAEKIVRTFERGFITENEAMRMLAELSY